MSWTIGDGPSANKITTVNTLSGTNYVPTNPNWSMTTVAGTTDTVIEDFPGGGGFDAPANAYAERKFASFGYRNPRVAPGAYVTGTSAFTLVTTPPGSPVTASAYIEQSHTDPTLPTKFFRAGISTVGSWTGGISVDGQSIFRARGYNFPTNPALATALSVHGNTKPNPSSPNALLTVTGSSPGLTTYYVGFGLTTSTPSNSNPRGAIYTPGSTTVYATSSDYRLKDNITPLDPEEELNKIKNLRPRKWKWVENEQPGTGFVAHEVQEDYPSALEEGFVSGIKDQVTKKGYLVYSANNSYAQTYEETDEVTQEKTIKPVIVEEPSQEEKDAFYAEGKEWVNAPEFDQPEYQSIDSSFLVSPLVSAVQALVARVEALESRVTALESA